MLARQSSAGLANDTSRRGRRTKDVDALTRRERDVALLVAAGKSNREIADELVVGERTVESHVSSILSKLEFSSRSQIAAWVAAAGLRHGPARR